MDRQAHDGPCYYCNKPTNGYAGNPGMWPVMLCHPDDPGVVKYHHVKCVSERLAEVERLKAEAKRWPCEGCGSPGLVVDGEILCDQCVGLERAAVIAEGCCVFADKDPRPSHGGCTACDAVDAIRTEMRITCP